jgi:hypothetical protein
MNTLNENRKNNVTEYPIEVEYQELVLKGRIIYSAKSFKVFLYEPVNGYDAGENMMSCTPVVFSTPKTAGKFEIKVKEVDLVDMCKNRLIKIYNNESKNNT